MTEKEVELVVERLTRRIDQANIHFLKKIAQSIKKISKLKPTEAQKLVQILKYGGDYEKIVKKIQKYTSLNLDDIDKIFSNYAKKDQQFNEKFYRYRNIPFLKYDENEALKRQTEALSNIARNDMFDFSRTNVLGYTTKDLKGNIKFTGLRETYNNALDEALLNVGQGKETFDSAVGRILNELGESGIRTLNYESGRSIRLDSAVKMHLQSRLRELHNETQQLIGKEIDADGVEITVHENPAPDHEDVQGRQFSNEEFEKLQDGEYAKGYDGRTYTLDHDNKNGYRPISELNCYHTIFSIVLGVSKAQYSDEQLRKIKENNEKGFELDGKHYTLYEGTQIQRRLERKIREQKDIQILARESDNKELIGKSQKNITTLTKKYKELSNISGLPTKMQRMKVSGYKRVKNNSTTTNNNRLFEKISINGKVYNYEQFIDFNPQRVDDFENIGKQYFDFKSNKELDEYVRKTSRIAERIKNGDVVLKKQLDELEPKIDKLAVKSPISFKLYSAKDINVDYEKDEHLLSASISRAIANLHTNKKANKEIITIFVEKDAKIISTYNTANKHFNRQAEILLPTKRKLEKIDKYNYILRK